MSVLKRRNEKPVPVCTAWFWAAVSSRRAAEGDATHFEVVSLVLQRVGNLLIVDELVAQLVDELPYAQQFAVHARIEARNKAGSVARDGVWRGHSAHCRPFLKAASSSIDEY